MVLCGFGPILGAGCGRQLRRDRLRGSALLAVWYGLGNPSALQGLYSLSHSMRCQELGSTRYRRRMADTSGFQLLGRIVSDLPRRPVSQTASHIAVAVLAIVAVLGWQAWTSRDSEIRTPAALASSDATEQAAPLAGEATTTDQRGVDARSRSPHGDEAETAPVPPIVVDQRPAARAPVKITATPAALRVWHNTRVRLVAAPGPDTAFRRFVWHFEDGSDPVEGASVEHVFPESVTDRHITLEAHRSGSKPLVISKRLPIERLLVVPVDGGAPKLRPVPKVRGLRVALLGAGAVAPSPSVLRRLLALHVSAFVVFGSAPAAGSTAQALAKMDSATPLLHVDTTLANIEVPLPDSALDRPPITVVHDPLGRITAAPGGRTWVLNHVAFVVHDSRPLATTEATMLALQRALQVASAYPVAVLLSARPLSPLIDGEQVADRAFRIYEHALRSNVRVAVSASSGVAYDGRYGGLGAVATGQIAPLGCARLAGSDHCQAGTVTLLDLAAKGNPRTYHLRQPSLTAWLDAAVLPPAVGKYRR